MRVPPFLFHRFIVLCHGGKTSVGEDKEEETLHLVHIHREVLVNILPVKSGSLSVSKITGFRAAPNSS